MCCAACCCLCCAVLLLLRRRRRTMLGTRIQDQGSRVARGVLSSGPFVPSSSRRQRMSKLFIALLLGQENSLRMTRADLYRPYPILVAIFQPISTTVTVGSSTLRSETLLPLSSSRFFSTLLVSILRIIICVGFVGLKRTAAKVFKV